jgi:mono/diheme cytochrome c family protein
VRFVTLSPAIAAAMACLALRLAAADPSYFREIRPILQRQCQGCHQPNLKSSNLDLTTYEGLATGGKRGPAPALIVKYLSGEMQPRMPMGQPPLPAEQVTLVRDWVAAGAKDDTPPEARDTVSLDKPVVYTQPPVVTALAYSPDGKTLAVSGNREFCCTRRTAARRRSACPVSRSASSRWPFRATDRCWRQAAARLPASARFSCGMWPRASCDGL